MKKVAKLMRAVSGSKSGDARLYKLSPEFTNAGVQVVRYVVVSAVVVPYSGPETFIFPAHEDGELTSWSELPGSFQGGLDHARALAGLGYEIQYQANDE